MSEDSNTIVIKHISNCIKEFSEESTCDCPIVVMHFKIMNMMISLYGIDGMLRAVNEVVEEFIPPEGVDIH